MDWTGLGISTNSPRLRKGKGNQRRDSSFVETDLDHECPGKETEGKTIKSKLQNGLSRLKKAPSEILT